jgi:hypothetical protein
MTMLPVPEKPLPGLANQPQLSTLQKVGLVLSGLADFSSGLGGRPTNFAAQGIQSLQDLQRQLFMAEQMKRKQGQQQALDVWTANEGDKARFIDSGGMYQKTDGPLQPGLASVFSPDRPGLVNAQATPEQAAGILGEYETTQSDLMRQAAPEAMLEAQAKAQFETPEVVNIKDNQTGNVFGTTRQSAAVLMRRDPERYAKAGDVSANPARDTVRDQRAQDNIRLYGVTEAMAYKLADGLVGVGRDPVNGSIYFYDLVAMAGGRNGGGGIPSAAPSAPGQAPDAPRPAAQPSATPQPAPEEDMPLLGLVDKLGGVPAVQETVGKVTFGAADPGAAVNIPRQRFRMFNDAVMQMRGGSRMSNQEQERTRTMLPDAGVFESPERAYDVLVTWHNEAKNTVEQQSKIANDPNMPPEMRKNAQEMLVGAQNVLRLVGDPSQFARPGGQASGPGMSVVPPNTPTATNPATGEKLYFMNGQWVPLVQQ